MAPVQPASAESKPSAKLESATLRSTRTLLSWEQIQARLVDLGSQIQEDYRDLIETRDSLVVLGVLNGGVYFLCDLTRQITLLDVKIGFMQCSSYGDLRKSSGKVSVDMMPNVDVEGQHILVVEDVLDSGSTFRKMKEVLSELKPASLKFAVFGDKGQTVEKADYVGFKFSPKDFLIGYGMDSSGLLRNMTSVFVVE